MVDRVIPTPPTISRRALLGGAGGAGVVLMLNGLSGCASSDDAQPAEDGNGDAPPNVIVIMADDMRFDELPYLPNLNRLLVEQGVTFTAARHNISLCSPARAGFLTGQYSSRHGVRSQKDSFAVLNDGGSTVAVWMQEAGYDTGLVGKYFTGRNRTAPGWRFKRQLAERPQDQFGFTVWDGTSEITPDTDQTQYLRDEVVQFIEGAKEPFFLWFTPTAPHWPFEAPPGHERALRSLEWPDPREEDVADKPPWIQARPPVTDLELQTIREYQRERLRELLGVDDTLASLCDALDRRRADNTVIMFSSDNGVLNGEHRLPLLAKNLPYEPSVRVPCILRAPGLVPASVDQPAHMAIDLTATCVQAAGARPDRALDGVSLFDLVDRPADHRDRVLLYDRDDRDDGRLGGCPPAAGVFTATRKLVRYQTEPPTYELYDLEQDPDELTNLADAPPYASERARLEEELDALLES